jgi:hypothetical protein
MYRSVGYGKYLLMHYHTVVYILEDHLDIQALKARKIKVGFTPDVLTSAGILSNSVPDIP